MSKPYQKRVSYRFKILGNDFAIIDSAVFRDSFVFVVVEELRKNGQEDCHAIGSVAFKNGAWEWWDNDDGSMFVKYFGQETADGIVAYLNTHGIPIEGVNCD